MIRNFILVTASMVAVSLAAQPILRNTTIIPLRFPRNYEPAILPPKVTDDEIHIGLVLPVFEPQQNASWTNPVSWIGEIDPDTRVQKEAALEIDMVIINSAEPVAAALPQIFRRFFPRTTVLQSTKCATCDVLFVVKAASRGITNNQNILQRLSVTLSMTAIAPDGTTLASFTGAGVGGEPKRLYWSTQTAVRGLGGPALEEAMDQLFAAFATDSAVSTFLKKKSAERARPSDLETTVIFDDSGSFLPNGRLDAGEQGRLQFTVRNNGAGSAFAVRLHLGMTTTKITLPSPHIDVGDIAPGETRTVDVPLVAANDVETAQEQLRAEIIETRGFGGRPLVVEVATERLRRPTFQIADVRLEDRGGQARGDGDGRPSNGETVEAVILIRNSGPGDSAGATLTVSSTPGVEVVVPSMNVGAIAANAMKEVRTVLRIPTTFDEPELQLKLRAVEARGAGVAMVESEPRWPLQVKRPRIEIGFRLFDGNSAGSQGNRDGVANNGETLEVALIPSNRGTLAARGLRLTLTSPIAGMRLKPSVVEVGDLPPLSEGVEFRVQMSIPRAVDRADLLQRLPLDITLSQTDFPIAEQSFGLPFSTHLPQLVASVNSQSSLIEGRPASFALDIRNEGLLQALDVKVDFSSDNAAIELLDALGTPARTVRLDVGSIGSRAAASRIQLKAFVRRNAPIASAFLKALVSQRDFEPTTVQVPLTILKEEPAVISTVPAIQQPRLAPRPATIPATISFQRHRDGSRLSDEAVALTFEVQSQVPVELVRLEHNHRTVELPQHTPIRTRETYLWQYEPVVQLEYGTNEFEVVVITAEGVPNSRAITLHREKPRGRIWLAIVGISNYREPSLIDLDFAKKDAEAIHAFYRQLGIPDDQTITLFDEEATLANIKRRLGTDLVKHASNPDDTVLIYFAGHGEREADRSSPDSDGYSKYLLPHDANPADLFGSALSMDELSRILQRLRSDRVVLIIDSCFSGAAGGRTPFEPNDRSRGVISAEFLSRMASAGKGRVILTASDSHEVARESREKRHGIFTYFLLEGLRGAADLDHDARIDVDEIYKYVSQKVSSATRGMQNPMRKSPNLIGTLVLGGRLDVAHR